MEIAFASSSGVGTRPLPLKFLLCIIGSIVGFVAVMSNTPITEGGPIFIGLFSIAWVATSVFLFKLDKTGEMALSKIPVVFDYLPKSNRRVMTRSTNEAGPFCSCSNLDFVDDERGVVHFLDGDIGMAFRVVGSASKLLFEEDKEAILNRVDNFFRKVGTGYEIVFVTAREPQNVKRQVANMDARLSHLTSSDDAELAALARTERLYLSEFVGKRFKSIHQYVVLKATNDEALDEAYNLLRGEVEGSMLMYKRCVSVYDDELVSLFESVYGGKEQ